SEGKVCTGSPSTMPPDSVPRIRAHQPYNLKARVMFTPIAYAALVHVYLLWSAPSVSSSKANSSTGVVFAPYGSRERTRGMASPMYRESSESLNERHEAYSAVWKILVRSRGLPSSCHESMAIMLG